MAGERVREVPREMYGVYAEKAKEFCRAMEHAQTEGDWSAACLNAVHCTISSADALTVFFLKERSAGQGHRETARLLAQTKLESVGEKINQFIDVLGLKTLVEYDAAEPTEKEARKTTLQAKRFHTWAMEKLEKQQ